MSIVHLLSFFVPPKAASRFRLEEVSLSLFEPPFQVTNLDCPPCLLPKARTRDKRQTNSRHKCSFRLLLVPLADIPHFRNLAKASRFSFIRVSTLGANYNYSWCLSQLSDQLAIYPSRLSTENMEKNLNQKSLRARR